MTIRFKILEANQKENQVIVKYYDDVMTEDKVEDRTTFALNLPIPTPTGKYLEEFVLSKAPTQFFVEAEAVANDAVDFAHVHALVDKEMIGPNPQKERLRKLDKIDYEITEFDPENNVALVRYFTNENPDGVVRQVLLPLINGQHPDEIQTEHYVMGCAPIYELDRIETYKKSPPKVPKHLKKYVK